MRHLLVLLLLAGGAAACENDPASFEENIAGTYTLQTVGGQPLPAVFFDDPATQTRHELTASELLIGLNLNFREIDTFRITEGTNITTQVDTFTGTWSFSSNNALTLTAQDDDGLVTLSGIWDGTHQLTFTSQGVTFVYRR